MSERSEQTTGAAEPLAGGGRMDSATEAFVAHRNLLFTVAYEMLGSAADAEDVLQETWLRWAGVDLDMVRDQRAYLVRITTRQALDRLRTLAPPQGVLRRPLAARAAADRARRGRGRRAGRQRLDGDAAGAGDAHADRAGGVRAARGVRSGVRRDRRSRRQEPGRGPPDRAPGAGTRRRPAATRLVSPAQTRDALEAFRRAVETGDLQSLLDTLAPDVVFLSDGGGVVPAALAPVAGAGTVARILGSDRRREPRCSRPRSTATRR